MSFITDTEENSNNIIDINGVKYTNNKNLPFEFCIFVAYHQTLYTGGGPREGKLSTTTVIGPLRKAILAMQYPNPGIQDISSLLASAKGTSHHESMRKALEWYGHGYKAEQRADRMVNGYKISGEYDIITPDGIIKDLKHTSNFGYLKLQEEMTVMETQETPQDYANKYPHYFKFMMQLSILKFLNPDLDLKPWGTILFMINNGTDFGKLPSVDLESKFPLFTEDQVEQYLSDRVQIVKDHISAGTLPLCTDQERGKSEPEYKLLRMNKSGKKATVRGSKFSNYSDFQSFVTTNGRASDEESAKPAEYKLCGYCSYSEVCTQLNGD